MRCNGSFLDVGLMQAVLFTVVALAWGFTWYAIHLQLGTTPDIVSIFWRFVTAAGLLWLGLAVTKRIKPTPLCLQPWFAALGLTLFSGNFLCLYAAEHNVPSGLVAVVFSMASVFNAFNQWWFRGIRPSLRVLLGAATGCLGVVCLFGSQISAVPQGHFVQGVLLALAGTYLFSIGNLVAGKATSHGVTLPNAIARGMGWGTGLLAVVILVQGHGFLPHISRPYLGGLAYLAIIGSVVGFMAYLSLVARVGAAKAAYVTVVSPVVALTVSSLLEGYVWTLVSLTGIILVLAGNVVIFTPSWKSRLLPSLNIVASPD
jgi:drug/metabolite transporter (DMT)-like permease